MIKRSSLRCKAAWLCAFLCCLLAIGSTSAQAATLVVTNTLNTGAGSLRQAIIGANAVAGDDTIFFDLAGSGPHIIDLTEALPALSSNIAIINDRPGDEAVTVRRSIATGTPSFRIFLIQPGAIVTISGLTITNGELLGAPAGSALGGGVRNDGNLTLRECTLTANDATGGNGTTGRGGDGQGGGLYNSGTLALANCVFSGNIARGGSGVGTGRGGGGQGGGLYNSGGTVTMTGCAFANNTATGGNGATGGVGQGGAIRNDGNITMTDCALNANNAGSAAGDGQGGGAFNSGTLSLVGCSLSGNAAFSNSGGVGQGGGIRNDGAGTLTLVNSTLLGNEARGGDSVNQAGPGVGGGIYNSGDATIRGSTLESNLALGGNSDGATGGAGLGGGLYNNSVSTATITLTNSTLSGNRAVAGSSSSGQAASLGGGLYMQGATGGAGGTATITSATIAYNVAEDGSGISIAGGTVNLNNTIVANNSSTGSGPSQRDVRGFLSESSQYNIIGDGSSLINLTNGVNGNQIGTANSPIDPQLGPLQDNGGPTETHALLLGSPALDKGDTTLTTDQRGVTRPYDDSAIANAPGGDGSDIGAFEARPVALPRLSINDITVTEGNSGNAQATFTVTLSAPANQTVTVQASTTNGIAKAPADYTATSTTVTFTPGQTSQTVTVPVVGDVLDEANEAFYVFLSAPTNAELGKARGVGTIIDDDQQPTISIENLSIGEGNSGQRVATVRITLSAPSGKIVRVNYATSNGTAAGGNDYVAVASTQVAFSVGQTVAYARVLINGDLLPEANETLLVTLSAPLEATLADNQAVVTILNDDSPPAITINDVQITEGDTGTKNLTFTVSLSKATGQAVTVNYATADGIARSTSDYVAQNGTLTFVAGGPLTRTISVIINGDTLVEGNETLYVLLSAATNASIGRARGTGTIQNDDASG